MSPFKSTAFGREALRVTRLIFYYNATHDQRMWDYVLPDVTFMGPIAEQECDGIEAYREGIRDDFELWFDLYEEKYHLDYADDRSAVVTGSYLIQYREEGPFFFMARQRFSAVLVNADGRPLLKHLHISHPDFTRHDGRDTGEFSFNAGKELRTFIGQLRRAASHDRITGLFNRSYLDDHYDALTAAFRKTGCGLVLLFDLNGFKEINDTYGHDRGDEVLAAFADALNHSATLYLPQCLLVRMGGDEFALVDVTVGKDAIGPIVRELKQEFAYRLGELVGKVSFAMGFAPLRGRLSLNECLGIADRRMFRCKNYLRSCRARHDAMRERLLRGKTDL